MRTRMTSAGPAALVGWSSLKESPCLASAGVDEADVGVVATVDDRRPTGLGIGEEEELVSQELHLQGGLFRRHRLDVELLGLDDLASPLVPIFIIAVIGVGGWCSIASDEVYRPVPPGVGTPDQLALELLHAVLELVDHPVD